jgi:hypothetical protein
LKALFSKGFAGTYHTSPGKEPLYINKIDVSAQKHFREVRVKQLEKVLELYPQRSQFLPSTSGLSLIEACLWYWRFCNEINFENCSSLPNYKVLIYEDMSIEPLLYSHEIFNFCGLNWTCEIEDILQKRAAMSVFDGNLESSSARRTAWKDELETSHIKLVENILGDSSISHFWA